MTHTIQLDQETERKLSAIAAAKDAAPEQLIQEIIREYLERSAERTEALAKLAKYRGRYKTVKFNRDELYGEDETSYLLKEPSNRRRLLESVENIRANMNV